MAMTLRLTEEETELLRRIAQLEGRSMQEIAREAVNSAVEQKLKSALVRHYAREEADRYREVLKKLAE
jgi:predicted transcriptional regulator